MNSTTMRAGSTGTGATHRGMRRLAAIVATAALAFFFAGVLTPPQAAQAADYTQCESTLNTPGQGLECRIDVVNNLDLATGATSSVTSYTRCFGAADAVICDAPLIAESGELITYIAQCNSSLNGGGGALRCHITVVNNIVGDATAGAATINQCNDSLGGGEVVLRACNPDGSSTTAAAISQCNGSDNGGTSSLTCTVTGGATSNSAFLVRVEQCNSSANGGGSLVYCTVGITDLITAALPPEEEEEETPTEEVAPPVTPTTGGTTSGGRRTSQVLGSQVVAGGQPQVLANTGLVVASPLKALMLTSLGVVLVICVQIARRRAGVIS